MFHWICPECGREIAPTVRECPVCDSPPDTVELVLAGVVEASARTAHGDTSARTPHVDAPMPTAGVDGPEHQDEDATAPPAPQLEFPGQGDQMTAALLNLEQGLGAPPDASNAVAGEFVSRAPIPEAPSSETPLIPEILDAKTAELRAVEAAVEAKAAELLGIQPGIREVPPARAADSKAVSARTVESKAVESKAVESRPLDSRVIGAKPAGGRTVESKLIESTIIEAKIVESKLGEPKTAEAVPPQPAAAAAPPVRQADPEAIEAGPTRQQHRPSAWTVLQAPANVGAKRGASPTKDHARAEVTPETPVQEPVLPSFVAPAADSLNTLIAAAGMLDEGEPPMPPVSGKLAIPLRPAGLTPAALAAVLLPASKTQAALPPEPAREQKVAQLPRGDSLFPLGPIPARSMKAAPLAQPAALAPRSAGVRAPHSSRPFLAPDMAPLGRYSPLENHPLRPAPPPEDLRKTHTAPRFTLPGPMLTRALASFEDRALKPIFLEARAFRNRLTLGWLAAVLVVGTGLGVGISSLISMGQRSSADSRPAASVERASSAASVETAAPSSAASPAPAHAVNGSNPVSKSIEVTGFRIVMDPSRKAEVQYLVVNHSPSRFSDATVYVTLRAAGARQPPLCQFSFAAPNLGPFEAKEMVSPIEKTTRSVNLPDWQTLRAEIEIGR